MAGAFGGQGSALVCGGATEVYQNCSTSSWGKKVNQFKSVKYERPKTTDTPVNLKGNKRNI